MSSKSREAREMETITTFHQKRQHKQPAYPMRLTVLSRYRIGAESHQNRPNIALVSISHEATKWRYRTEEKGKFACHIMYRWEFGIVLPTFLFLVPKLVRYHPGAISVLNPADIFVWCSLINRPIIVVILPWDQFCLRSLCFSSPVLCRMRPLSPHPPPHSLACPSDRDAHIINASA